MIKFLKRLFDVGLRAALVDPDQFKREAIPDLTGKAFSFDDIVAYSTGWNEESPRKGDLIVVLNSCSMGMSVRSEERLIAEGEAFSQRRLYGEKSEDLYVVPTNDGKHVPLSELRPMTGHKRVWVYVT